MRENDREPEIKSVKRSYDIVETILERGGATTMEIARSLEIPVSTTFDHVTTLEQVGYVVRTGDEYHLSSKYLKIGTDLRLQKEIYQKSWRKVNQLSESIDEHAVLMLEEEGYGVYYHIAESESSFRPVINEGSRAMLHTNAPGKVLLAFMDDQQINQIIDTHGMPAMTDNTVTERDELQSELEEIRRERYGHDIEEVVEGMYGVAAPVLNRSNDSILGAIGVYSPADREFDEFLDETLGPLQRTTNMVELDITYEDSN